jgi:hypothetical protein
MSSLSHVLSFARQQSFVPDGGPAKLILGLGSTTKCHGLFRGSSRYSTPNRTPFSLTFVVARP